MQQRVVGLARPPAEEAHSQPRAPRPSPRTWLLCQAEAHARVDNGDVVVAAMRLLELLHILKLASEGHKDLRERSGVGGWVGDWVMG